MHMDLQLVLIILCVLVALVFMIRRMRRAMRSGQCGCGCDGGCDAKAHPTCNCGGQATIEPLHPEKREKNKLS